MWAFLYKMVNCRIWNLCFAEFAQQVYFIISHDQRGLKHLLWLLTSFITIKINTLRLRQNGCHFLNDIFKGIFLNENVWISIKISLNFVPRGLIKHWFRKWLGAGQVTNHYLNQWWFVYWRIYASLGLNELKFIPQFQFHNFIITSMINTTINKLITLHFS